MIKHEYTGCAACHGDPSGGGVLTEYGRAQDVLVKSMSYRREPTEEAARVADFGWGLAHLPEWLLATVTYRGAVLATVIPSSGGAPGASDVRYLNMLVDARAQASVGRFVANVSFGYGTSALALPAFVAGDPQNYLLSRTHWVGLRFLDGALLVRAGRIDVPYGLRNPEHTTWVRERTRTDVNAAQQHGASIFWGNDTVRTEVMAIAGNYQISPDALRERGYTGYVEVAVNSRATAGVSSRITEARRSEDVPSPLMRQAHGVFARYGPSRLFALLAEADLLVRKQLGTGPYEVGGVGLVQGDIEPIQGFHVVPAFEALQDVTGPASIGGWLTLDWFFFPHAELRVDGIYRTIPSSPASGSSFSFLAQLHLYL
jgi:hypothetical protein